MVFPSVSHKVRALKAKVKWFNRERKLQQTRTVFQLNPADKRVFEELVFAGETAKHVF